MPTRIVETERNQVMHGQLVHVAQGHGRAGRVLLSSGHKVALIVKMLSPQGVSMRTKKNQSWRVMRLKPTLTELLGHVSAPDEESALAKAAEKFEIRQELQRRLLALPID